MNTCSPPMNENAGVPNLFGLCSGQALNKLRTPADKQAIFLGAAMSVTLTNNE